MDELDKACADEFHSITDESQTVEKDDTKPSAPFGVEEFPTNIPDVAEFDSEKSKEAEVLHEATAPSQLKESIEQKLTEETEDMEAGAKSAAGHLPNANEVDAAANRMESQLESSKSQLEREQKPSTSISFLSPDRSGDTRSSSTPGKPSDTSKVTDDSTAQSELERSFVLEPSFNDGKTPESGDKDKPHDRTTYSYNLKNALADEKTGKLHSVPLEVSVLLKDDDDDADKHPSDEDNANPEQESLLPHQSTTSKLRSRFKRLPDTIRSSSSTKPKRAYKCPKKCPKNPCRCFALLLCRNFAYLCSIAASVVVTAFSIAALAVTVQLKQEVRSYHKNFHITSCFQYVNPANFSDTPVCTCATLKLANPSLKSGHYSLLAANGSVVHGYCDMTLTCGGVMGWMRVAHLDTRNVTAECPTGFLSNKTTFTDYNPMNESCQLDYLRTCVMESDQPHSCSSTMYSTNIEYSKVCGRIIGYQFGSPDGFTIPTSVDNPVSLSTSKPHVDGVTLTYGQHQQHIWTFAAAYNQEVLPEQCLCNRNESVLSKIGFVQDHYFCDSAVGHGEPQPRLYINPLWDGYRCANADSACCTGNSSSWFYRQLPLETNDEIELTMCRDESRSQEDIGMQIIDILVH